MSKLMLLLLVVGVVALLLSTRRRIGRRPPPAAGPAPQPMLTCAHCGVHLPAAEALRDGAHAYCSAAHRLAGPRAG